VPCPHDIFARQVDVFCLGLIFLLLARRDPNVGVLQQLFPPLPSVLATQNPVLFEQSVSIDFDWLSTPLKEGPGGPSRGFAGV